MSHKAIVAVVTDVIEIPGADKIHVAVVLGEKVIVSKDVGVGYVGVLFPVDLQLSQEYCYENNLFRHGTENKDNTKTGFFESSRRVRCQPFLKVRSSGYFASLDSLNYIYGGGFDHDDFLLGSTFDELCGKPICCKYISQATKDAIAKQNRPKQAKLDYAPFFAKHVDSEQFQHSAGHIPVGSLIHFHAKVHGTSHRSAYTYVSAPELKWYQRLREALAGKRVYPRTLWDYVVGTRNVVLTAGKEGFHGSEQFRFDVAESLKPHMTKGMTVYGEIAGYANGKPIMAVHSSKSLKDKAFTKKFGDNVVYKYGCAEHEYRFHIYRITYLNHDGVNVDFSQAQLDQWCKDRQILGPLEVHPPMIYDGNEGKLRALVAELTERKELLGEDFIDPSIPSEGIILRVDTGKMNPYFLKSKAYHFRVMESLEEVADLESM